MTLRRVDDSEARELISWLDQPPWSHEIGTGYDRDDWADSLWVLHAMFERDPVPDVTYEEMRRRAIPEGAKDPMVDWTEYSPEEVVAALRQGSGGVAVMTADGLVETGIPLGFVTSPGPPWRRVYWAEFAARQGFTLGSNAAVPPCFRWFPERSFPTHILPPPEGSLDELTLHSLIGALATQTEGAADCVAFYGSVATMGDDNDRLFVFTGPLQEVPELVINEGGMKCTPNNVWPVDRSWFVYTDADLMATKVCGTEELIAAIEADDELETVRWEPTIHTYLERHNIEVAAVHKGDRGAPTIELPIPLGWVDAGTNTPDWAYTLLVYAGPQVAQNRPNIAAALSKLSGELDPQAIIDLAPGLLRKRSGYEPLEHGEMSRLCGYPAYQENGTLVHGDQNFFYVQKVVIVPAADGAYLLQLTAYGLLDHREMISAAADVLFAQTTVTV